MSRTIAARRTDPPSQMDGRRRRGLDNKDRIVAAMLEMVREYAGEHLKVSREVEALQRWHAEYYLELAEGLIRTEQTEGGKPHDWAGRLDEEQGNFRAALEWCKSDEASVMLGLRLASALAFFWKMRGYLKEGRAHLADLLFLTRAAGPNPDRALARRNVVLQAMVGNGVLAQPEADVAKKTRLQLTNAIEMKESFGLYFKEQVRRELVERFGIDQAARPPGSGRGRLAAVHA